MSARHVPLLITNGEVVDDRDMLISQQAEEIRSLRDEITRLRTENNRSVSSLRKVLTPLHRSLQQLFGEMDAIDGGQASAAGSVSGNDNSKWEFWKRRYPGRIAEAIDILMVQPMNTTQLAHALKCDKRTVTNNIVYTMNGAGLLVKNGGIFSLKQL